MMQGGVHSDYITTAFHQNKAFDYPYVCDSLDNRPGHVHIGFMPVEYLLLLSQSTILLYHPATFSHEAYDSTTRSVCFLNDADHSLECGRFI